MTRRETLVTATTVAGLVLLGVQDSAVGEEQQPKKDSGSVFIIKLHGIKLPKQEEDRIAKELEVAFMRELAKIDLKQSAPGGFLVRNPLEWLGKYVIEKGLANKVNIPLLEVREIPK